MKRLLLALFVAVCLGADVSASITITPLSTPQWTGTATGVDAIYAELEVLGIDISGDDELYKYEGSESGSFQAYYETEFSSTPSDPSNAEITWVGEPPHYINVVGLTYLLVKDGNQDPAWYLFNISSWDGMEDIDINGFWPDSGSISHVSIYGVQARPGDVPEPASLAIWSLIAAGGAAVAASRRRRRGRWTDENRQAIRSIIERD